MIIKPILLTLLLISTLTLIGCGSEDPYVINTKVGKQFEISLRSNPIIGSQWKTEIDDDYIEWNMTNFKNNAELDIEGEGGIETLTFRAKKEGETKLTMNLKKHGEEDPLDTKSYKVIIK